MDGLSAAASVAGIASLAVQLTESITKLCKLLSAIRHASDDIEDIIDDLEVLTCVIVEIQRCEELFGPQHATAKAIMRCRRQVQALENMVKTLNEELEKDSRWRRNHAALKAVMKGDKVKVMREKIGEAKDTLSLALQASSSRVQHTQLFAVMRLEGQMGQLGGQASQIQALFATSSGIGDQPSSSTQLDAISASSSSVVATSNSLSSATSAALFRRRRPRPVRYQENACWGGRGSWTRSLLGTLRYKCELRRPKDEFSENDDEVVEILFEPSWWLQTLGVNTLFQAQMDRSFPSGWNVSLRTPHLMSEDLGNKVVTLLHYGDLDSLKDILSAGQVTIHSVNAYGKTLLHSASIWGQPQMCKFLTMAGADPKVKDDFGWEPIIYALFGIIYAGSNSLEKMRILVGAGEDFLDIDYSLFLFMLDHLQIPNLVEHGEADEKPLCWLTEKLLFPLQFYGESLKLSWWSSAMGQTRDHLYTDDFLRLAFNNTGMVEKRIALIERIATSAMSEGTATLWLDEMETLNFVVDNDFHLYTWAVLYSRKTTMSSTLMGSPYGFSRLRDFLQICRVAVEDFVRGEVPLLQEICDDKLEPWTEETLLNLFDWDFGELILDADGEQRACPSCSWFSHVWVKHEENVLWDLGVKQIRSGKSPDGPFEGEKKMLAEKWRGYCERYRVAGICFPCQKKEEAAMARTENGADNLEPSPLLIDL